jgi:hypothetical protein
MADGNVTQIDRAYLNKFKAQIGWLRSDVEDNFADFGEDTDDDLTEPTAASRRTQSRQGAQ